MRLSLKLEALKGRKSLTSMIDKSITCRRCSVHDLFGTTQLLVHFMLGSQYSKVTIMEKLTMRHNYNIAFINYSVPENSGSIDNLAITGPSACDRLIYYPAFSNSTVCGLFDEVR